MFLVFIFLLILILVSNIILGYSFLRNYRSSKTRSSAPVRASVIIALKNEEINLTHLIDSIKNQNYPNDLLEIITVDDNSIDNTYALLCTFKNSLQNLIVVKSKQHSELLGKKAALSTGLEIANSEILLFTDGDCTPDVDWVTSMVNTLADTNGLVFGNAPFYKTEKFNFINRISCYEQLRAFLLTSTFANFGMAYSATGRSLAIRKDTLIKLGGYNSEINLLSGDDDLLVSKAIDAKLPVIPCYDGTASVKSNTKYSVKDYLNQKVRHLSTTSLFSLKSKLFLAFYHLINIAPLTLFPLVFWSKYFILILLFKIIVDFITIVSVQKSFGYKFNFIEKLAIPLFYELFIIVNFLFSKVKTYNWK